MTTELFPETTEVAVVEQRELSPLQIYAQAVQSGVSPDALTQIFALCERHEANLAAEAYGVALAKFQAKCPQIRKERAIDLGGGKGPMYADLADIMQVIRPVMAEFGLSATYSSDWTADGKIKAICSVRHGRHVEKSEVTFPVPTQMRVNDTQRASAALSYAKRAALVGALGITLTDEDTDAAGLCDTITDEEAATLREWIEASGANEKQYLKFLGVASLADIPQRDFPKALQALKDKAAKR